MLGPRGLLEQVPGMGAEGSYKNFIIKNKVKFSHGHHHILLPRTRGEALLVSSSLGQMRLWRMLKADAHPLCRARAREIPPELDTSQRRLCPPLQHQQCHIHLVGEISWRRWLCCIPVQYSGGLRTPAHLPILVTVLYHSGPLGRAQTGLCHVAVPCLAAKYHACAIASHGVCAWKHHAQGVPCTGTTKFYYLRIFQKSPSALRSGTSSGVPQSSHCRARESPAQPAENTA